MHSGNHTEGREMRPANPVKIIGIAACGDVDFHPRWEGCHYLNLDHFILDSTITGRQTDSLQLYSLKDSLPLLEASGPWRWEWPHRNINIHCAEGDDVKHIYEVIFDTAFYFDEPFIVAGTCLNNNVLMTNWNYDEEINPALIHVQRWVHFPTIYYTLSPTRTDSIDQPPRPGRTRCDI